MGRAKSPRGTSKTSSGSRTGSRSASSSRSSNKDKGLISSAIQTVADIFGGGNPNAIDLLKADHRKVEDLFSRVKANEDGNNQATFRKIKQELDVHSHIEEQVFYPHLLSEGDEELKKIVREGIEEHGVVKDLLMELDGLSGDSATFKAKLKVLMENVEHHVEEEEGEMFDMAEAQIPEDTLERLGSLLQAEKARVMKRGGPTPTRPRAAAARQR